MATFASAKEGFRSEDENDDDQNSIVEQPTADEIHMKDMRNFDLSLLYLKRVSQLMVEKNSRTPSCDGRTDYFIKNLEGDLIYTASEFGDCFGNSCLQGTRAMDIRLYDMYKKQILQITRSVGCGACCFPCCTEYVAITSPDRGLIGTIEEQYSCMTLNVFIKDQYGKTLLRISRNTWKEFKCFGDACFKILDADSDNEIGMIIKKMNSDRFKPKYNIKWQNVDLSSRIMMLATVFFIHFRYFEVTR